jgi:hypothetical protein
MKGVSISVEAKVLQTTRACFGEKARGSAGKDRSSCFNLFFINHSSPHLHFTCTHQRRHQLSWFLKLMSNFGIQLHC